MNSIPIEDKGPARWLALVLNSIAAVTLFSLMIIVCVDVIGRYFFNRPLTGSTELIEMSMGVLVFSVFPVISWRNEHIVVDLLDHFTPPIVHLIRLFILNIVAAIALYFLGSRIFILGNRSLSYGEESEYLGIPLGWTINFIALMSWVAALTLITLGLYRALRRYQLHKSPEASLYR